MTSKAELSAMGLTNIVSDKYHTGGEKSSRLASSALVNISPSLCVIILGHLPLQQQTVCSSKFNLQPFNVNFMLCCSKPRHC